MFISIAAATAALAFSMMPTIHGYNHATLWTVLQCEDREVTKDGNQVDNGVWKSDPQLTWTVCNNEYKSVVSNCRPH